MRSLFAAAVLAGSTVIAQTSYPMIGAVHPAGVQRGTGTVVTVYGKGNFAGAYKLVFDGSADEFVVEPLDLPKPADVKAADPKAKADPKAAEKADPKAKAKAEMPAMAPPEVNAVRFKVTPKADARLGVREFRVATPRGVSSIGLLVVGDEPEALEVEPNDVVAKAQALTLPVTVNGKIEKAEDVDWYKFQAAAGEEISFAVIAARLQDRIHDLQEHVDPIVSLFDASGKELAGSDDYHFADPFFMYKFEKAGEYRVSIREVSYKGNPQWTYRLAMSKRPYVLNVFPPAVQAGKPAKLEPVGFGKSSMDMVKMDVPADWPAGEREVQLTSGGRTTNPVPLVVSDLPVVSEAEPNDEPATASAAGVPGGFVGRIDKSLDVDYCKFTAKKGVEYVFEVFARRQMSELDAVLSVHDAAGKQAATADDSIAADTRATKDPRIVWKAPADGSYLLRVTDLHSRGGPTFVYFLTAREFLPDFTLRCDPDKAQIGPGTSTAWYPIIERLGGFAGAVTVEVQGLPAGVKASPLTISPGMNQGCIVVTAAADAKMDTTNVRVSGWAMAAGADGKERRLERASQPIQEIYMPGGGRGRYPVGLQTVSVTEPSDVTLSTSTKQLTLIPGKEARIEIDIKRDPRFTGPISLDVPLRHLATVYANPLPTGVTLVEGKSKLRIGPKDTKGWVVLAAAPTAAEIKDAPFCVMAYVSINFVVKVGYSTEAVSLDVAPGGAPAGTPAPMPKTRKK